MTPDEYCQNKAATSGSSFYYSFMFLPELQRRAITALYAFCREVDDVVDECKEESIAHQKLDWWRQEIKNLFSEQPQHPVTKALQPLLADFNLAEEYFLEIIDGMEMDLAYSSYQSFRDLSLYCYRAASVVGILSAEIFGFNNRMTLRYAHDLGMAFQLTNILRDVREDAQRGRIYIPADELDKFGIKINDLHQPITSSAVKALFKFQADRAREFYKKAFDTLPDEDRYAQRTGLIMSEIYYSLLDEIEEDGFRVLEHKIKLTPLRKFWLAWRASRREKKRYKRYQRLIKST
ncbi:MAG: presqualene diphosphate synthase HpnD [Gammaproteobacteria bacterium]|nr:presqualene diphosphate synthase HpnD [Gammaproteobacteria bacterium]MDH5735248.1 presqualene diphosphate synthase HpnD [Gammaproteobacteria bacterium]